ncbi:YfhD family protein [Lottiidibacillus patelloidae]|uniref:YfhD family protein n=1 Tax=Lottiidibacillus patelloidae TaxID=2670334 RepID=A0A263BU20_9BACI|nr:YfhD family protein [Lottiidibacillus patelloidae]OZM57058.1 YfhD family protein [Lottiidibacillus patelloidae]
MGKKGSKKRDKNSVTLPNTPKSLKNLKGVEEVEFSRELADSEDMEAQARMQAADARAKSREV